MATISYDAIGARALDHLSKPYGWAKRNGVNLLVGEVGIPADNDSGKYDARYDNVLRAWMAKAQYDGVPFQIWTTAQWGIDLRAYRPASGQNDLSVRSNVGAVLEENLGWHRLNGTNFAGADFGQNGYQLPNRPGTYGSDYYYPSTASLQYLASRGIKTIRLPFRWERLQPTLNAAFDSAELGRLTATLDTCRSLGMKAICDLHNYGAYSTSNSSYLLLGQNTADGTPLTTRFVDFWSRFATQFASHAGVAGYGLVNEPHDLPGGYQTWQDASSKAAVAIRNIDPTGLIFVSGYFYATAGGWEDQNGQTAWLYTYVNGKPLNQDPNVWFEAHQYFDIDGSGTYTTSYNDNLAAAQNAGYTAGTIDQPTTTSQVTGRLTRLRGRTQQQTGRLTRIRGRAIGGATGRLTRLRGRAVQSRTGRITRLRGTATQAGTITISALINQEPGDQVSVTASASGTVTAWTWSNDQGVPFTFNGATLTYTVPASLSGLTINWTATATVGGQKVAGTTAHTALPHAGAWQYNLAGQLVALLYSDGNTTPTSVAMNLRTAYRAQFPAGTRTVYVTSSGSDSAAGTQAAPYATIQKAVDSAQAGDRILVGAGQWGYLSIYGKNGSASKWISIESADDTVRPIIDVANNNGQDGVDIQQSSYVGLYGFEIRGLQTSSNTNPSGVGVFRASSRIAVWNNDVHDFPGGGVNCFYIASSTYNGQTLPAGGWDLVDVSFNTIHQTSRYSPNNTSGISFYGAVDTTSGATWDGRYGYRAVGNYIWDVLCTVPYTPGGYNFVTDGNGISVDSLNVANNLNPGVPAYTKRGLIESNLVTGCGGRAVAIYNSVNVDNYHGTYVGNLRTNSPAINGGVESQTRYDNAPASSGVVHSGCVIVPLNTANSTDSTATFTQCVIAGGTQAVPAGNLDRRSIGAAYLAGNPTATSATAKQAVSFYTPAAVDRVGAPVGALGEALLGTRLRQASSWAAGAIDATN